MTRALVQTVAFAALVATALFASAGTLAWPMAWAFLVLLAADCVAGFLLLPPDLIAERSSFPAGTRPADLLIAGLAVLFVFPVTLVVSGLDARFHWSPALPPWVSIPALGLFGLGYGFALWAARTNRFFASVVRVQAERGHHVVTSGPYALVRHPGYAGGIVGHVFLPIALGSLLGLVPALVGCSFLIVRIGYEEQVLLKDLPGYRDYMLRVTHRLLPGVW